MSEYRPPNKNGKKSSFGSVPMRSKSNTRSGVSGRSTGRPLGKTNIKPAVKPSGRPGGIPISKTGSKPIARPSAKSKYETSKKPKLPTPVLITNILMIGVILSICGVIFAIAFNNIKYDKADASRNQLAGSSSSTSSIASSTVTPAQSSMASAPEATSSDVESMADSGSDNSTPAAIPTGDYDKEFFKDDLFIGDSIFTGLYLYGYLERSNVAAMIGYTAYSAQTTSFDETFYKGSAVDYAKSLQPKHIIIMLGSNALSSRTDFDDFENSFNGLITKLKSACPQSKICVVSVPPVTANSSAASYTGVTNTIIDTANASIKKVAKDLSVIYYDLNSVLKDANGCFNEQYAELDGMHFMGATYPIFLSGVQKAFG